MDSLKVLLHQQGSRSPKWAVDQCLMADMADFEFFPISHFYHTPHGTNSLFRICFDFGTLNDSLGRGELVTLQCAE